MFKRSARWRSLRLSALAGALILAGALVGAASLVEGKKPHGQLAGMTRGQVTDCVAFVREQRRLANGNGVAMSRRDQKTLLHDCNNGQLEARIAEQERVLAALNAEIRQLDLELDEQAQILDRQGRVLAKIIAVNGQLILRAQDADQRIAAKLQEAERILERLTAS